MTAVARIFQPTKTAMQSGRAKTKRWFLEFDPSLARYVEPLMGWTGVRTTLGQISLSFESQEAAVAFATKRGIAYQVEVPHRRKLARRSYADNFGFDRLR
jgi:hypothetical protein